MGRALENNTSEVRDIPEAPPLEEQLASMLHAVEAEPVPENLRKVATDLQAALDERRQRQRSN